MGRNGERGKKMLWEWHLGIEEEGGWWGDFIFSLLFADCLFALARDPESQQTNDVVDQSHATADNL